MVTVEGDAATGCGFDFTTFFLTEPLPDGTTTYEVGYDEDGEEYPLPIYDGPYVATWLEV